MNRITIFFVALIVVAVGAWYSWSKLGTALTPTPSQNEIVTETEGEATTTVQLAEDLYPLYRTASWTAPRAESFEIGTTTYTGKSIVSDAISAGMNPAAIFTPFQNYYDQKLKTLGWQTATDLEAGGHTGGQNAYRKGSDIILTRFSIVYHTVPKDAPSECPCDVTLSLFSTK